MKLWTYFCTFALLFSLSRAITFELRKYQYFCLYTELKNEDILEGDYVVSGYNEKSVVFNFISPGGDIIRSIKQEREGRWQYAANREGEFKSCFRNLKKDPVSITWTMRTHDHKTLPLTTTEDEKTLRDAVIALLKVRTNFKFDEVRLDIHQKNIATLLSEIKWTTFYKIAVLALCAAGQGYFFAKLFQKKGKFSV